MSHERMIPVDHLEEEKLLIGFGLKILSRNVTLKDAFEEFCSDTEAA